MKCFRSSYKLEKKVESRDSIPSIRRQRRGTKTNRTELRNKLQRSRNTGGYQSGVYSASAIVTRSTAAPSLEEEELLGPRLNEHLVHSKGHDDNTDNFSRENCARCGRKEPESDFDTEDWGEHILNWVECTFWTRWEHFACADYWPKGDNADQWSCAKCLNI